MIISAGARKLFIFAVILSQMFSPVLFVPGLEAVGLNIFRFLLILISAAILATGSYAISPELRAPIKILFALTGWMGISIAWTEDVASGIRHLSYILNIALSIFALDFLLKAKKDFQFATKLLALSGLIAATAGFYEIVTGNHFFDSSLQDAADLDRSLAYVTEGQAWFTFGNPNDLAVHVTVCALLAFWILYRSGIYRIGAILLVCAAIYLSDALEARIVMGSILVFVTVYGILRFRTSPVLVATIGKVGLALGAIILLIGVAFADRAEFLDVSAFIRIQLVLAGIQMAFSTLFLGIGTGGFESEIWHAGFLGQTYGITNPHNAILRLFAENGVVGLSLFVGLLAGPLTFVARSPRITHVALVTTSFIVVLPLLLSAGSDPLTSSSLQLAMAMLWISCRFMRVDETKPLEKIA